MSRKTTSRCTSAPPSTARPKAPRRPRGGAPAAESLEIFPLTAERITALLVARGAVPDDRRYRNCQRHVVRWPFPGTVELWIPDRDGGERYLLATSVNLSDRGLGVEVDERLPEGMHVGIAFHEPEASFHGRATVRHCSDLAETSYLIGLEFDFAGRA